MGEYAPPSPAAGGRSIDASGTRVAIVAARYNDHISRCLVDGALTTLRARGADVAAIPVHWVPGAFELPLVAKRLAASGALDAVICLGVIIRGETAHFEYVAAACAQGIARASLDTGIPIAFGVLTTDNEAQAMARAGGPKRNKGSEAAETALEMVMLLRDIDAGARG